MKRETWLLGDGGLDFLADLKHAPLLHARRFSVSSGTRFNKTHPALKHAAYSSTTLLPGEDKAAFEKLHRDLIAELVPVGALEEGIVADIASLLWRKQNL